MKLVSVIMPAYNVAPYLEAAALSAVQQTYPATELIIVDDGSMDHTYEIASRLQAQWPDRIRLIRQENRGLAEARNSGIRAARGEYLLMMDGDGQNDPRDYPALLALVESGKVDLACGWRVDRHDSTLRRIMSRVANVVRGAVLKDGVHDSGCQLRVMRREVREAFFPMELMQSFIPALAVAAGFRVGEVPVRHHARTHGDSKYGLGRLWWRPAAAMIKLKWRLRKKPSARELDSR